MSALTFDILVVVILVIIIRYSLRILLEVLESAQNEMELNIQIPPDLNSRLENLGRHAPPFN